MEIADMKEQARQRMQANWPRYVMISIAYMLLTTFLSSAPAIFWPFGLIFSFFLYLLVQACSVVYRQIFLQDWRGEEIKWGQTLLNPLIQNFWRYGMTKLLQYIYIFFWTCLFVLPGIYKALSYSMVTFILNDQDDLAYNDAIRESERLMQGGKWAYLRLNLSFLGWDLVNLFCAGLLTVYILPYRSLAQSQFYLTRIQAKGRMGRPDSHQYAESDARGPRPSFQSAKSRVSEEDWDDF
ncbi:MULTISPECIES: DUF975 family protein [Aerococcus]|uniref:DUF975 family protein n=1 Tax=Aerococcus sanguinicola TaxID=119206 RepID=A0A5N1GMY0_9LACT|nr:MULTISPECIES: DUF975 family protein [Aerococcus]KAA9302327.1 DUF975 family protein [Aerococcus sanguinicola]MDK6370007.1 DUF975 family protein [Aerococcus sp. UMB9870]MDK6678984.1 DUF975 family protein [Aerococcus sp. UMB8608]MDK6687521.1 DUF975 family protein [Aerococcus sp. UMB8623]MDK6939643.1 DUF975 family protein [Aerococcus sp. UMB8487]